MQARQMFQQLSLGPDESPRIQELQDNAKRLSDQATALQTKIVPRPIPGQYLELAAEVQRFVSLMGSVERVLGLVHSLQVWLSLAL